MQLTKFKEQAKISTELSICRYLVLDRQTMPGKNLVLRSSKCWAHSFVRSEPTDRVLTIFFHNMIPLNSHKRSRLRFSQSNLIKVVGPIQNCASDFLRIFRSKWKNIRFRCLHLWFWCRWRSLWITWNDKPHCSLFLYSLRQCQPKWPTCKTYWRWNTVTPRLLTYTSLAIIFTLNTDFGVVGRALAYKTRKICSWATSLFP